MRYFNTAGAISPDIHYRIPPLERMDLKDMLLLLRQRKYFVVQAPRQTGKTTMLLGLRDLLNSGTEGAYRCLYMNVAAAQASGEHAERAMRAILSHLACAARVTPGDELPAQLWPEIWAQAGPDGALQGILTRWAQTDPRPLVLMIDEIDALLGDTLLSVLRQLRAGYESRPGRFPQSIILCGVRDYRVHSAAQQAVMRAAAHSTSRRHRSAWETSPTMKCVHCCGSAAKRLGKRSRRRPCSWFGRRPRARPGW